ncbi:MAG: hypothetical protein ACLSHG_08950 [Oscillospiraceae bacterium]
MLGDIVKVTPSSKMVGDLAIFMVQNDLTPENIVERGETLAFPDSVVSYFKGMMGQPPCGFPEGSAEVVLKGEKPITCRPGELLEPVDFDKAWKEVRKFYPNYRSEPRSSSPGACTRRSEEYFCATAKEYGYHHAHGQPCVLQRHGPGRDEQDQHRGRQDPGHQVRRSGRPERRRHPQRSSSSSTACAARSPCPIRTADRHGQAVVVTGRSRTTRARSAHPSPAWCRKINVKLRRSRWRTTRCSPSSRP